MVKQTGVSSVTRRSWLIVASLFVSGVATVLSGVYFLFLPSGGYQGGRNPLYAVTVLPSATLGCSARLERAGSKGTTFRFTLPRSAAQVSTPALPKP